MRSAILILALTLLSVLYPSQTSLRKQATDDGSSQPMTAAELAELGDPMFRLVLRDNAAKTSLDEIEQLITGQTGRRNVFVVDEHLQDPSRGQSRRAVITFSETNNGIVLNPNVALSISFSETAVRPGFIEAWGWDDARSRYNYYKLEGSEWTFRGSSDNADQLTPTQRRNTCMACHINGGPLMKELPIPWNNWHSFRNLVPYLSPTGLDHWPIAESARFKDLRGAETLETQVILPSTRQFNGRRLNALVVPAGNTEEVRDSARVLRPVFSTTEYNVTSANELSGLHPFPKSGNGPANRVSLPDTFFLNANLLAGGGLTQYQGIGVPEAREFASLAVLEPAEYVAVVKQSKTTIGGAPGDTNFAWFVPEPSHVDNHMVDLLIRRGVITREFAAAALAVDLETPVFSKARASLLAVLPKSFRFVKRAGPDDVSIHPDELTKTVIATLRARNPAAKTPEAEFLEALLQPDPIRGLREKVLAYRDRIRTRLAGAQRQEEIDRLYSLMLRRRADAAAAIPALIESPFLFPRRQGQ